MHWRVSETCLASLLASIVALNLAAGEARAASAIWTGASSGAWNSPANWTTTPPGGIPLSGDMLLFDGASPNVVTNNSLSNLTIDGINFGASAAGFTLNGNGINLDWETVPAPPGTGITYTGDIVNDSANAQTINLPITLNPAKHVVSTGAAALNLHGAITQPKGSTAIFNTGGGAINLAGAGLSNDASGILGGWATLGIDWAALDAGSNVVPYTAYTDVDVNLGQTIANGPNTNVRIRVNGPATALPIGDTQINTLMLGDGTVSAAAQTVSVDTGNRLILGQNGGIYNVTGSNGNTVRNLVIGTNIAAGGELTAGDGVNPANITFSGTPINVAPQGQAGVTTVNAVITDNGSAPVSVTIRGGYVTLPAANTYSGGTYVVSGRLSQPNGTTVGTGPIYVFPGGMINPGAGVPVTIPNDIFIAGNGTTENNGLGAIRMFQNTSGNNTVLTGTVTLMADASVSSNGNVDVFRNVGLTGKITGPGGLGIGSPVFSAGNNNGAGIVVIGALAGSGVRNDYAGDTTINGTLGGGVGSTLRITNPDANNIIPHGVAGSFTGGATGNVVLNATLGRQATFDLNGSEQTINGLRSTADSPTENFVQSSAPGARLLVGDSDASATFDGTIQDVAVGGVLSITKIGAGTQALTAFNTYTGDTRVYGGTLRIANAFLNDSADVHITAGAVLNLDFAGMDSIDALFFNGLAQPTGTYGAAGSGATFVSNRFGGAGVLNVQSLGTSLIPGDFDLDGDVDAADLAKWQADFDKLSESDADFDGDSDGADFLVWQRNLGRTSPATPTVAAVPEVDAALLGLVSSLGAPWLAASRRPRSRFTACRAGRLAAHSRSR